MGDLKDLFDTVKTFIEEPEKRKLWKDFLDRSRAWLTSPQRSLVLALVLALAAFLVFRLVFSTPTIVLMQLIVWATAALISGLLYWIFYRLSRIIKVGFAGGLLGIAAMIVIGLFSPSVRTAFDGFPTPTPAITSTAVLAVALQHETPTPSTTATNLSVQTATSTPTTSSASRDAAIVSVSFRVNDQLAKIVDLRSSDTKGIRVLPGDHLTFSELWFQNSGDEVGGATVNAEIFTNGEKIGKFEGVPFQKGVHPLGKFIPSTLAAGLDSNAWVVQSNWQEIRIVLVVYKPGQEEERKSVQIRLSKDGDLGLVPITPKPMLFSVAYSVDNSPTQVVDIRKIKDSGILIKPGQKFKLVDVWYQSDIEGTSENTINIEIYLYQSGKADGNHGYITKFSLIEAGRHPINNFSGYEWSDPITKDTNGFVVRLILDGKTVVDEISVPFTESGGADLVPLGSAQNASSVSYDFKNGCISDLWQEWPHYTTSLLTSEGKLCKDLSSLGMLANNDGLRVFVKKPAEEISFGIFTAIPDANAEMVIRLQIDELSTSVAEADADFYVGLVESAEKNLTGKFLVFRAYKPEIPPAVIYGDYPAPPEARRILVNSVELRKEVTIIIKRNQLSVSIIVMGLGQTIEIPDIPNNPKWDSLFIGYRVPAGASISAMIKDVQVDLEN